MRRGALSSNGGDLVQHSELPTPHNLSSHCRIAQGSMRGKRCQGKVVSAKVYCPKGCVVTSLKCNSSSSEFRFDRSLVDTAGGDANVGRCEYKNNKWGLA